jgi:hypothetical protein
MSYKCPFCERILSTRSSYSQHVSIFLKIAEEEDKIVTDMNDMSIEGEEVSNPIEEVYLNFNKYIIRFQLIFIIILIIIIDGLMPRFPKLFKYFKFRKRPIIFK